MASLEDQQALLLYRVGPVLCCSPSYTVLSIIQPVPLTHPPGTDAARPGIFRHSGHVIKTEDLRVRFGVAEADRKPGRMVITEVDSGRTAFWVDDIIDVISMPGRGWGQLPPHLPKGIFSRTLLLNEKIYLYADFDGLQKLQGHGLLKTYIEQLLQEKIKTAAPTTSTTASTPMATKPADTLPAMTKTTPSTTTSTEKTAAVTETKTTAPQQANTTSDIDKEKVATTKPTLVTSAGAAPVTETKPVSRPVVTPHQKNQSSEKTQTIPAKKIADVSRTSASSEKPNTRLEKKTHTTQPLDVGQINKPSAASTTAAQSRANEKITTETNRGFPWFAALIVLLLLSGSGVGIFYYLPDQVEPTSISYEPSPTIDTYATITPQAVDTYSAPTAVIATATVEEKPVTTLETGDVTEATPETTGADYQAKIEKDNEGITIVIKAPKEERVLKEASAEDTTSATTAETPVETETSVIPIKPATQKPVPPNPPQREEILHIVVKGDTLWAIAKRYVNNPFRYPELARLSNIKNPDLIYPGNRVRIIREFN